MEDKEFSLFQSLEPLVEGKWAGRIINLGVIPLLLLLSVALPPISLAERVLDAGYTTISRDVGGSVQDPDRTQMTFRPEGLSASLKARLVSVPRPDFLNKSVGGDLARAAEALPANLEMKSPLYRFMVKAKGSGPEDVNLIVPIPNDAEPYATLDLYHWTGEGWQWLPSRIIVEDDQIESDLPFAPNAVAVMQTRPLPPTVSAEMAANSVIPAEGPEALVEVNPWGLYVTDEGAIGGQLSWLGGTTNRQYIVLPTLSNEVDGIIRNDLTDNILVLEELQEKHIENIVNLVLQNGYPGIDIDYKKVDPNLKAEFVTFMTRLAERLGEHQKLLTVRVSIPTQIAEDRWDTGAYDWAALGQVVDGFKIPALADSDAFASGGQMDALLNWAVGEVDRYKIQLIISAASQDWVGDSMTPRPYGEMMQKLVGGVVVSEGKISLSPGETITLQVVQPQGFEGIKKDEATQVYWFNYVDEQGQKHTVRLENAESLAYKLEMVKQYNLRGIAVQDLLQPGNDDGIWSVLAKYMRALDFSVSNDFKLVWTVLDAAGEEVHQETTPLTEPTFAWTAPEAGEYQVTVAVSTDGEISTVSQSGSAQLALVVAEATPTPTPAPTPAATATPVPKSAATPTPKPVVATSGGPTTPTSFGYGIQAHFMYIPLDPIINSVKGMGFDWVKMQVPWKDFEAAKGAINWGELDRIVNGVSGSGLKILLSVVKAPNWARPANTDFSVEGPPANPQDFANFLSQLASRYKGKVQAYEVWNEQNLWYEWGGEPLDARRYVELLKVSYNAIKAADPNAIVVSGALTPAGDVPGKAIDDITYLEQMYQAGLKNYCDAVGAHPSGYNVPPDADWRTWSDPKARFRGPSDNRHHSWVFRGTMEGYRNVMVKYGDGNKKIWPTEFGWAVSSSPSPGYEYAADNTLQEQADFTVKAYQMGKNWGWVGVMFLWNLNFKVVAGGSEMAQWGIIDSSWRGLPVYNALATMAK
ncbi:MAG: glycosyl hydrolase family 18 protein [Anaerolineae bacterium]